MGRALTGSVDFHGSPPRWWARVTIKIDPAQVKPGGKKTRRDWVDLERPDLKNTPEDKKTAKRLALRAAKVAKDEVHVGEVEDARPAVGMKFSDLGAKWLAHLDHDPDVKPTTRTRYRTCWLGSILPHLGAKTVAEITPPVLRAWIWSTRETLSPSSVRTNASVLVRIFKTASAEGWIPESANPMRSEVVREALPTIVTRHSEDIVNLSRVQIERLFASELDDYTFGFYLFAVLTGTRDGETLGAQFGDLRESEDGTPYVQILRQAVPPNPKDEKPAVTFGGLKTKNAKRKVPLHGALVAWLAWWRAEGWKARVGRSPLPGDVLFPSTEGEPWRPRSAEVLRDHLGAAKLPRSFTAADGSELPFEMHSIRHTFVSLLAEADVPGDVIERLLGHAQKTTMGKHYQGFKLAPLVRAIERIILVLPERSGTGSAKVNRPAIAQEDGNLNDYEGEMEKTIRCTVCTWRGPWEIAESAPRIRSAEVHPAIEELQNAYAEHQAVSAAIGSPTPPPCPMCGHHTVAVKMHGYRAAV